MAEKIEKIRKERIREITSREKRIHTDNLFRMPWSNSDNAFSWLEITRRCDLNCSYCYQTSDPSSDKTISRIEKELQTILRLRKTDTILISGGEPLLHPELGNIVRMVKENHVKPVLLTNGNRLNQANIRSLKKSGLFGFIIHVDRGQERPGWEGKSEKALNQLRQRYSDMIHEAGGMICGFNTTILPETLNEVPDIIKWTVKNMDKVCTNTIIPVRVLGKDSPWDLYVNDKKIDYCETAFSTREYTGSPGKDLTADDLYNQVRKVLPAFRGNSFLGGTEVTDAPKWFFADIIGFPGKAYGYMGPKTMEFLQNGYHFFKGRYLSFLKPSMYGMGKVTFLLGIIDRDIRRSVFKFMEEGVKNPLTLFKKAYVQTLIIMQPQDILEDGRQDLCDGCPNKTYHNGGLVSACRKEEYIRYGGMVTLKKKDADIFREKEAVEKDPRFLNISSR